MQYLKEIMDASAQLSPGASQRFLLSNCAQLRQFVIGAGDAIVAADPKGTIVLWNRAAGRIFGFSEMEALDRSLDLIIPAQQRQRHWEGYYQTMATGVTKYGADVLRVPALTRDGHTLSIAFTVCLLFDASHDVSGIVAIVRDETQRYHEEREMRRRLAQLEAATGTLRRS